MTKFMLLMVTTLFQMFSCANMQGDVRTQCIDDSSTELINQIEVFQNLYK